MKKKGKLFRSALIVSAAVAIATGGGLSLTSCDVGSSSNNTTSTNSGKVEKVELYAAVQGVVKDDTGKPVVGAKVIIGNLTTTTNEGGYYYFEKVPVTEVYGAESYNPTYDDIIITIKAPPGSNLVDTIMVTATPVAQQFDSAHNNGTGTAVSNPNTTFTPLLAQANTAIMAHKAASVYGVLRMATTGEPIANAIVKISNGKTPGCELPGCQYQVDPVVVTTNEKGEFSVSGLLNNTTYNIEVAGYNVSYSFTTPDYQGEGHDYTLALGNITATPIVAADSIPPKIVVNPARYGGKVIGLLGTDLTQLSTPGGDFTGLLVLAPGVDGANKPIPVMFTEKMNTSTPLTPNESVVVYDDTAKQILNVASLSWDVDGKTLLVSLTEPVPAGHDIYVRLRGYEFQDLAGNPLQVSPGDPPTNVISTQAVTDPLVDGPLGNKKDYVQIQYEIYDPTTAVVAPVTDLVQLDVPGADGNAADDDPTPFYEVSSVFENYKAFYSVDEDDTNPIIAALNDSSINNTTDDQICKLANKLNSNINSTDCYVNDATKLAFTPVTSVSQYKVKVNGTDVGTINIDLLTSTFSTIVPGLEARLNGGKVEIRLIGVAVGDKVDVVSLNGFGDEATAASVILEDTVPMFVTAQDLPTNGTDTADIITGGPSAGSGGYLVDIGSGSGGTGLPYFNVRADMYAPNATSVNWDALKGTDNYYTTSEWSNYSLARTLGLWISEPTQESDLTSIMQAIDGGSPVTGAITSATYAGYVGGYPLVAFSVPNILDVQKWDRFSLQGAHDRQGNVSGPEAQVIIADKMPPMVTRSYLDGNDLVIEFTEDVSLTDANNGGPLSPYVSIINGTKHFTFDVDAAGNPINVNFSSYTDPYGNTLNPADAKVDVTITGNVMRISVTDKNGVVDTKHFFEGLVYSYLGSNGQYNTTAGEYVTGLNTPKVPDLAGNEWTNNGDNIGAPPLNVPEDTLPPKIDGSNVAINNDATPLKLAITDETGTAAINMQVQTDGDGIWQPGDSVADTYTIKIAFRENIVWDANGDGTLDEKDIGPITLSVNATGGATYVRLADAKGTISDGTGNQEIEIDPANPNVLYVTFKLNTGTVAAGDNIVISGITDADGNAVGDITITLRDNPNGITVSPNAY